MNILTYIAHAGEAHESTNESLWHYLGTWYIALIVFALGTYVIASAVYAFSKKSLSKTLSVLMVTYLVVGLTTYSVSPLMSVLSILIGFVIAASMAYVGLLQPGKK